MTLNIPAEYQQVINQAVASGMFTTAEDAVKHALGLLAEEQAEVSGKPQPAETDAADRIGAIRRWSASHDEVTQVVDDSRESIYQDRGL